MECILISTIHILTSDVYLYITGPENNIITEEHINRTCQEHGGYASLYYKENWGRGIYYTDENLFLYRQAFGSATAVTGRISRIYRQNRTRTVMQDQVTCVITQPLFMVDIQVDCVLRPPNFPDPLPNPMSIKYECKPIGFKEDDEVILIVGSLSHDCKRIGKQPCFEESWGYGYLAYYRNNPNTLDKLMRICGYQNPKGNKCPRVVVTPETCSLASFNIATFNLFLIFTCAISIFNTII